MDRIMNITPSWDKRNPDPTRNYGIHGCDLRMVLRGELGAVQFVMSTGWFLKSIDTSKFRSMTLYPMAVDVGYHSPKPMYEEQQPMRLLGSSEEFTPCEYLNGKPCYYDGSSLNAEKYMDILISQGDEALWEALEKYYCETFGELK